MSAMKRRGDLVCDTFSICCKIQFDTGYIANDQTCNNLMLTQIHSYIYMNVSI